MNNILPWYLIRRNILFTNTVQKFKRIAAHQLEKGKKPRRSSIRSPDIKPGE